MTRTRIPAVPSPLTRETFTSDLVEEVIASLPSPNSRRSYRHAYDGFFAFAGRRHITLNLLLQWRDTLLKGLTPNSVNVQIVALRKLMKTAYRRGLTRDVDLLEIEGIRVLGRPTGNWLTREQCRNFLAVPNRKTLKGKRTYCILAILLGCALRRSELAELQVDQIQMREGRWVLANLRGKGGRLRTVAVPGWVKQAIESWTKAASITSGFLIRRLSTPDPLSSNAIWNVVQSCASQIGVPNFGPHDLRRTCAKLCRDRGGRIEQIQLMLGHSSIATTERYLGAMQDLRHAVNDDLGIGADAA